MNDSIAHGIDEVHPQMLRRAFTADPQKLGEAERRRAIGQMFDDALDRARITKQAAAAAMGYTDQGVIGRWISGLERVQIDKCALLGHEFIVQFAAALVANRPGAVVETVIRVPRSA